MQPIQTRALCLLLLIGLATLPAFPAQAGPPAADQLTSGDNLVVLLPGVDPEQVERVLKDPPTGLEVSTSHITQVSSSDQRLLNPLRRRVKTRLNELAPDEQSLCQLETSGFRALMDQIEEALDYLDYQKAATLLARADTAFTCEHEFISPALLGQKLFLAGLLKSYTGPDDQGLFAQAVAMAPEMDYAREYAAAIQKALAAARKNPPSRARVKVHYVTDLAGLTMTVDGVKVETSSGTLLEGTHFVQLLSANGKAVAGMVEPVHAADRDLVWPPAPLRPAGADQVKNRLVEACSLGHLDPALGTSMESLLAAGKHPWIVLVAPATGNAPARAMWIQRGRDYQVLSLADATRGGAVKQPEELAWIRSSARRRLQKKRSWVGVATTIGLGAATLGFTGYYAYNFHKGATGVDVPAEDAQKILEGVAVGRVGSLVCLTGTALSALVISRLPARLLGGASARVARSPGSDAPGEPRSIRTSRPTLSLAINSKQVTMHLGVTW